MIKIHGVNNIRVSQKNNKKIIIFVDMDGVVSNWIEGCVRACDLDIKDNNLRDKLKSGMQVPEIEECNLTEEQMWNKILETGSSWWKDLDVFPWAEELLNRLSKHGEVAFLTSPGDLKKYPESVAEACKGKMQWIYKHFKNVPVNLCQDKHLCANRNSILIDDSQNKLDDFKEYGGQTFLWPNQFKLEDGDITIDKVFRELESQIRLMKT